MIPPGKRHSVRLCATFVKTVNVPGRYGDGYGGHGLSLLVTPRKSGGLSKTWAQAISPNGTKASLGLGSYPVVTLAMARDRTLANARAIAEGRDPRRRMRQVPTFAQANETVIAIHAEHWKSERTEGQWRASMRDYVQPRLARKRVDAATTARDPRGVHPPTARPTSSTCSSSTAHTHRTSSCWCVRRSTASSARTPPPRETRSCGTSGRGAQCPGARDVHRRGLSPERARQSQQASPQAQAPRAETTLRYAPVALRDRRTRARWAVRAARTPRSCCAPPAPVP